MSNLDKKLENRLHADLHNNEAAAREERWAGENLAKFAVFLENEGLPSAGARAAEDAVKHRAASEKHEAEVSRLVNLLRDPERLARIAEIAKRALARS
jgi:hypothetical protein